MPQVAGGRWPDRHFKYYINRLAFAQGLRWMQTASTTLPGVHSSSGRRAS